MPSSGETTMKRSGRVQPLGMQGAEPGLGDRRAGIAAEQRVGGGAGQSAVPGDQVPHDRADQPAEDHAGIHDVDVDQPLADRLRHRGADHEGGDEVEEGRPEAPRRPGVSTRVETTVAIELALS